MDGIGQLLADMKIMITNLRDYRPVGDHLVRCGAASNQIHSASEQIASCAEETATAAAQQAGQVQAAPEPGGSVQAGVKRS